MAIQGVTYDNQRVSAADHASLFQMFITDGVMSGCGMSTLRNTLTISSGSFILAGRLTKIVGSETITIPNDVENTTKRLIAVCDMGGAHTRTEFGQFYFKLENSDYTLKKENINSESGRYYEVEWGTLTIGSQGIITAVNKTIPDAGSGGSAVGDNHLTADDFEYVTGQYQFETSGDDWELAFLSSGTFKLNKNLNGIDIFIVGAGFDGYTNVRESGTTDHDGGDGGYYHTWESDALASGTYEVTIGASGGAISSIGERAVSSSDEHKVGGLGSVQTANNTMTTGGTGDDGVYAFGSSTSLINSGRKYGASAGGGGARGYTGSAAIYGSGGAGGVTGAGSGGAPYNGSQDGSNATANTGAGGGGRAVNVWNGSASVNGTPGIGGSGIIVIRNHRTTPAA